MTVSARYGSLSGICPGGQTASIIRERSKMTARCFTKQKMGEFLLLNKNIDTRTITKENIDCG